MNLLGKLVYRFVILVSLGFLIDFLLGDFYIKSNLAFATIAVSIEGLYGLYEMKKKKEIL